MEKILEDHQTQKKNIQKKTVESLPEGIRGGFSTELCEKNSKGINGKVHEIFLESILIEFFEEFKESFFVNFKWKLLNNESTLLVHCRIGVIF